MAIKQLKSILILTTVFNIIFTMPAFASQSSHEKDEESSEFDNYHKRKIDVIDFDDSDIEILEKPNVKKYKPGESTPFEVSFTKFDKGGILINRVYDLANLSVSIPYKSGYAIRLDKTYTSAETIAIVWRLFDPLIGRLEVEELKLLNVTRQQILDLIMDPQFEQNPYAMLDLTCIKDNYYQSIRNIDKYCDTHIPPIKKVYQNSTNKLKNIFNRLQPMTLLPELHVIVRCINEDFTRLFKTQFKATDLPPCTKCGECWVYAIKSQNQTSFECSFCGYEN